MMIYDQLPQQILTIERLLTFHARQTPYNSAVVFLKPRSANSLKESINVNWMKSLPMSFNIFFFNLWGKKKKKVYNCRKFVGHLIIVGHLSDVGKLSSLKLFLVPQFGSALPWGMVALSRAGPISAGSRANLIMLLFGFTFCTSMRMDPVRRPAWQLCTTGMFSLCLFSLFPLGSLVDAVADNVAIRHPQIHKL